MDDARRERIACYLALAEVLGEKGHPLGQKLMAALAGATAEGPESEANLDATIERWLERRLAIIGEPC